MSRTDPTPKDARLRAKRALALGALLLMVVVVVASAWLRLAQPRPACIDWPGCRDLLRPTLGVAADAVIGGERLLTVVRGAHRLSASALLLVVIALAALALARAPRDAALGRSALAMLALALGLAALGVVTPGARSAAVLLGNLLGGLALLALAWATWRRLRSMPSPRRSLARWAAAGAALWLLQAALGARSGTAASAVAPVAHLALALLALPCAFAVGHAARRQGCGTEGRALMTLAALQGLLGAAAATLAAAPVLVLAHNGAAAAGIALLVGLALAPSR